MHTTGLAREPIGGLYERAALADALREARARTLATYAHLDLASLAVPCIPLVNPPLWELAHIAWFQERWCLRLAPDGSLGASLLEGADALLDSSAVPHDDRWRLPYPPAEALFRYMDETLEATLAALHAAPEGRRYFFALALLHEDMHAEALLMTLQTLGLPGPPQAPVPDVLPVAARDVRFDGGEFAMGAAFDAAGFVFDNEKWAHPVRVGPFAMASRPTSEAQFARFVDDGGYRRPELWTRDGWAWREREGREAPAYWRREGAGWSVRRFESWRALEPHGAMMHVSRHEARAWCRWAGRRLPTEAEWEFAARAEQASRLDGLIGGVWEWTDSEFMPYPGFSPDPYRDYSAPWFGSHAVLRGGCFATRPRLANRRFRNFYLPERCDPFAGLRTCAGEST